MDGLRHPWMAEDDYENFRSTVSPTPSSLPVPSVQEEADLASVSFLQILRQQQKRGTNLTGAIAARARLPGLPRPTQNARSETLFVRLMIGLPNHHRLNLHRLSRCPLRENVSWV
jgi:hypothetical protein